MGERGSIIWSIFSKILWAAVFLIIVLLVNVLNWYIQEPLLVQITQFLNSNIFLIILLVVLFLIAELFERLRFPLNLPTPIFDAGGALMITIFIFRVVAFFSLILGWNLNGILKILSYIVYPAVVIITLILGYVDILSRHRKEKTLR
ncbi:hypothetical protein KY308_03025 [Candidatus Woesearchaeota archaeon]|nr:hypothetical protein [Candidatus Woesearchaeota archaeon]